MANPELLPCPLCGSSDLLIGKEKSGDETVTWYAISHSSGVPCGISFLDSNYDRLITAWNTRTPAAPPNAEDAEALEAITKGLRDMYRAAWQDGCGAYHDLKRSTQLDKECEAYIEDRFDAVETLVQSYARHTAAKAVSAERQRLARLPKIVCLCGSTKFGDQFTKSNLEETLKGNIVLSIGCATQSDAELQASGIITDEVKQQLDELHKRKIDLADEILVLNVGGYVGSSTRSEIEYAEAHGKPVRWLDGEGDNA